MQRKWERPGLEIGGNAIATASNKNVIGVAEQQKWGSKQGGIIIAAVYNPLQAFNG